MSNAEVNHPGMIFNSSAFVGYFRRAGIFLFEGVGQVKSKKVKCKGGLRIK
jgi:hypothetical protein